MIIFVVKLGRYNPQNIFDTQIIYMGKVRYILLFVAAMVFVTVFSYTTSPIYQVCGNTPDSPIFQIIGKYEH